MKKSNSPARRIMKSKSPTTRKSVKSKSPVARKRSKSPSIKKSIVHHGEESFIECIQRVKNDVHRNPEKALECLHAMIHKRKNVDDYKHPLVDKNNLYKSVVVYGSAKLNKNDTNQIKRAVKSSYKPNDERYQTIKTFLKDVKFEKYQ